MNQRELNNQLKETAREVFKAGLQSLANEEKELKEQFNIARNLACSEWSNSIVGFFPNRILPESCRLLNDNFNQLRTQISLKRYVLIMAMKPHVPKYCLCEDFCGFDIKNNVAYWSRELKKKNPQIGQTPTTALTTTTS